MSAQKGGAECVALTLILTLKQSSFAGFWNKARTNIGCCVDKYGTFRQTWNLPEREAVRLH